MKISPDPRRFRAPWPFGLAMACLAGCHASQGGTAQAAGITITHAVIPASPSPTDASAFMVIENSGAESDSLMDASSPDADAVMLHTMVKDRMEMVAGVAIPAGGRVALAPGGYHLMLHGLAHPAAPGDTLTLRLEFTGAGMLTVRAPVLRYTEAVEEVSSR